MLRTHHSWQQEWILESLILGRDPQNGRRPTTSFEGIRTKTTAKEIFLDEE